jgi:ABC-2 type transport system permease protein
VKFERPRLPGFRRPQVEAHTRLVECLEQRYEARVNLKEIGAICRGEVTRGLQGGRAAVLLVLFFFFSALVLTVVGFLSHRFNVEIEKTISAAGDLTQANAQLLEQKKSMLAFFSNDKRLIDALAQLPLVLLVTYWLTSWFIPFFVALMGFDQLSGELAPKSIRFLVVRVERRSIVFGKLLAQAVILFFALTLSTLLMMLAGRVLNPEFTVGSMLTWSFKLMLSFFAIGLSWLTLTSMCSAFFRQPAVSLVINMILILALAFVSAFGNAFRFPGEPATGTIDALVRSESWAAALRYISVWSSQRDLLHPMFRVAATAFCLQFGFALLFVGLGELSLAKKDV